MSSSSLEYFLSAKSRSRHSSILVRRSSTLLQQQQQEEEEEEEEEDCVSCQGWVTLTTTTTTFYDQDEKRVFCKLLKDHRDKLVLKVYRNIEQQFEESLYDFNVEGVSAAADDDNQDDYCLRITCTTALREKKVLMMRLDSLELFKYWYNGLSNSCGSSVVEIESSSSSNSSNRRRGSDEAITMQSTTDSCSTIVVEQDKEVKEDLQLPLTTTTSSEKFKDILCNQLNSIHDSLLNAITSTTTTIRKDDHQDIIERIQELLQSNRSTAAAAAAAASSSSSQINGIAQSLKQVSEFLGRQVDLQNSSEKLLYEKMNQLLSKEKTEADKEEYKLRDILEQNSTVVLSRLDLLLQEITLLNNKKDSDSSDKKELDLSLSDGILKDILSCIQKSQESVEKKVSELKDASSVQQSSMVDQLKQLLLQKDGQTDFDNFQQSRSPSPSRRLSGALMQDERMHEIQKSMYYVKDKLSELGRSVDHLNANVLTSSTSCRDKTVSEQELIASLQREMEKILCRNLQEFGDELKQRHTAIEHRLINNSDKHSEIKSDIKDSTTELKRSIDGSLQSVGKELLGVKSGIDGFSKELQTIVSELKQQKDVHNSENLSLYDLLSEQKRCLSKLLCDVDSKRSELHEITVQYERLDASVQQLMAVKTTLEIDIERERNILQTLKTQSSVEHSQLVSEVAGFKEQRARLLNQISLLEGSSVDLKRERRNTE